MYPTEEKKPDAATTICKKGNGFTGKGIRFQGPSMGDVMMVAWKACLALGVVKKLHITVPLNKEKAYSFYQSFINTLHYNRVLITTRSNQNKLKHQTSRLISWMENCASKAEVLKPVILRAGVPLALSLAGFIYAWIMAKKSLSKASSITENELNSPEINTQQGIKREASLHSIASMDDEEGMALNTSVLAGSSVFEENPSLQQEIIGLRSETEGLQMRDSTLRLQFDRYCDMKEQESLLMEIRNLLSLEAARVEFLDKEISSMEAENRKLESFLVQYLTIIGQLEDWKSENRLLQRKLKKLQRKSKAQSHLIKEQTSKIRAQEAEILENRDALQMRIDVINQLEDEIRELHRVLEELQEEKNELVEKLDAAEKSYASKIEGGHVSKEEYKQLLNELEQLKKERGDEVKEVIYLRWTNACLRHELLRQHEQQQNGERQHIEVEFEGSGGVIHYDDSEHELGHSPLEHEHHNMACFGAAHTHSDGACSKRKKLIKRLKRWVEGSEKARVKPEEKETYSASYGAEETKILARRSC